jgi:hypothetical protein
MPQIRDILGHVYVEIAPGKRKCRRKRGEHSISKGEACLVIKGGPYNAPQSYCRLCASDILDSADGRLTDIRKGLSL